LSLAAAVVFGATLSLSCGEASAQSVLRLSGQTPGSESASSWLAGAVAGYNWHHGSLLYGFETDFQATDLNASANPTLRYNFPTGIPGDVASARSSIDWYGTVRGRLGTTIGPALLYLTGGLAYGQVDLSSTLTTFFGTTNAQMQPLRFGGVVGAGLEYLVAPNVMLTFQYQYIDLGKVTVSSVAAVDLALFSSSPF